MADRSITGSDAVIMLSVPLLFPIPQQLQEFAADDVFDSSPIQSLEKSRGVDGVLSAGFVFADIDQNYSLQSNSPSCDFFDQWWSAMQTGAGNFPANGIVVLPSLGTKWSMTKGFLMSYSPIPAIKKLAQPRKFMITWESIRPSLTG